MADSALQFKYNTSAKSVTATGALVFWVMIG